MMRTSGIPDIDYPSIDDPDADNLEPLPFHMRNFTMIVAAF
ncbi:MAG: hypothetical protein AAF708_01150 [Deinococcota bacterium]